METEYQRAFLQLLRARRRAITPPEVGLPQRPRRRGIQVEGLLQVEVDLAIGPPHGIGTYQKIESGAKRPSAALLRKIAQVLQFKESEYSWSHKHLFEMTPAVPLYPDAHLSIPPAYQDKLDGQRHPTYVQNWRWEPIYCNAAFVKLFPSGQVPNCMAEWWLTSPEARDPEVGALLHWEQRWAAPLVAQFRASLHGHPEDPVLRRIERLALQDEVVRELYERGQRPYLHPDGDRRPMRYDGQVGYAQLLFTDIRSVPGATEMCFVFEPDESALAA